MPAAADEDQRHPPIEGGADRQGDEERQRQGEGDPVTPPGATRAGSTVSRKSPETGTSWARPSGVIAKAKAVTSP